MIDNTFVCTIICIIAYNNPVQNIYAHVAKIGTQVQPGLFSIKNFLKFIVSLAYERQENMFGTQANYLCYENSSS